MEYNDKKDMILKWIFDRLVSLIGLLVVWPILLIVAIMIKAKMPSGPDIFTQKCVGKGASCLLAISSGQWRWLLRF